MSFLEKKIFSVFRLISFLHLCLLLSSATVKMDNGENVIKNFVMQGMMTLLDHKSNEKQKHKQQN
jgi:ABC-type thiamin/hydroxymethylpyrimidine transport system permease subunit